MRQFKPETVEGTSIVCRSVRLQRTGYWEWTERLEGGGKRVLNIKDGASCVSWVDASMEEQNSRLNALAQATLRYQPGSLGWDWRNVTFRVWRDIS